MDGVITRRRGLTLGEEKLQSWARISNSEKGLGKLSMEDRGKEWDREDIRVFVMRQARDSIW